MSAQEGKILAISANQAIEAGGMTVEQARQYIDGLTPYLQYKNLAAYFQLTIDSLQAVVAAGGQPAAQPQDSAGSVAVNNQAAKTEGAVAQNPPTSAIIDTSQLSIPLSNPQAQDLLATNNRLQAAGVIPTDSGLNAKTITLAQSQATPPYDINALAGIGANSPELDITGTLAATQPGVGAGNGDGATITGNTTKDIINATFQTSTNQRIYTQPNILDDYASYTYQISWYLLSEEQYNALVNSAQRSVGAWSLLMQSGGIPLNSALQKNTDTVSNTAPPTRSQFFPVDYYLDDLEIHSLFPLGGTHMAHCANSIKFKVVEPNGLTLIDNLYSAVNSIYSIGSNSPELDVGGSLAQQSAAYLANNNLSPPTNSRAPGRTPNYIQAHYCLTIKFYGYDVNGNLQAPLKGRYSVNNTPNLVGVPNDVNAVVLKIYPFLLSDIKFAMAPGANSRGIEYHVEGIPTGQAAGFGQARGTIPFNFQLSGTTVKDLLIGKSAQSRLQPRQDGRVPSATPPGTNIPPAPSGDPELDPTGSLATTGVAATTLPYAFGGMF